MSLYFNLGGFSDSAADIRTLRSNALGKGRRSFRLGIYTVAPGNTTESGGLAEQADVMLRGLKAMSTQLQTLCSCRKEPHTRSNKTFSIFMFVVVRWVGMYNLITYEMACTVNALKFRWTTFFFFVWMNTVSRRKYIFALLIRFSLTFLSACCFLFQSVT